MRTDGAAGIGHPVIAGINWRLAFTPALVMAVAPLTVPGVTLYGRVPGLERLFAVRDVRLQ